MKSPQTTNRIFLSPFSFLLSPFLLFCLSAFSFFPLLGQKTTIAGKLENNRFTQAELRILYKEDGVSFGNTKIDADGSFKLTANLPKTDLYKLVFEEGKQLMLCLSPNQNIELVLDGENLQAIKSVKGSLSIEFCMTAAKIYYANQLLPDSINRVLQADKDVQFYNEFQSQFKPYTDANAETDAFCLQVAKITDSLQQFVNSKLIKGKVDPKEIDLFIYSASNFLKEITAKYTKYKNYVHSMSLFYDFKNHRNKKFENFYETSVDRYLELLEQRNETMEKSFSGFAAQIEHYLQYRDSLLMNDLADKKKEKEFLAEKIIALSKSCSNVIDTESMLLSIAKAQDGYAKYLLQEAQRKVSEMVQKYQSLYDTESKKRNDVLMNYLLSNKYDLAVLMFIDLFPRDQYAKFHKEIITALNEKYPEHPLVAERFKVEKSPANATSIGAMAPDLAFENPDGKIMKLSDLKGKVVLLDFWAAWCRPCRMENPNVVRVYHKYHDKGFEVFSVSLDREKTSWVKAIQDDGLIWPNHVSDLGYWQSQAAKIYGVSSIPTTFLIDKDGRIIAKNLRGAELENKLKELFE